MGHVGIIHGKADSREHTETHSMRVWGFGLTVFADHRCFSDGVAGKEVIQHFTIFGIVIVVDEKDFIGSHSDTTVYSKLTRENSASASRR